MTIEQAKQAIKACSEHYCTSCPVEEIPYECTCDNVVTILKDLVCEYEERIAIMRESMEALEKRCNALDALEQRCKTLEALEKRQEDLDRIKVTRCKDCRYFEPSNAEEGDYSGYCRNDYAPCQNQTIDAWWFCGCAEKGCSQ